MSVYWIIFYREMDAGIYFNYSTKQKLLIIGIYFVNNERIRYCALIFSFSKIHINELRTFIGNIYLNDFRLLLYVNSQD